MTNEEAIKMLKSKMDGHTDTSYEWAETVRMAIRALEQEPCNDCVSRQAVLEIQAKYAEHIGATKFWQMRDDIRALPSVTPQLTRWIPVSERLPKGSDIVLLSLPPHIYPGGEECSSSVICGHYIGGRSAEWGLSDGDTFGYGIVSVEKGTNPVAWKPLPKPYNAESEVKE